MSDIGVLSLVYCIQFLKEKINAKMKRIVKIFNVQRKGITKLRSRDKTCDWKMFVFTTFLKKEGLFTFSRQ